VNKSNHAASDVNNACKLSQSLPNSLNLRFSGCGGRKGGKYKTPKLKMS
jgi:hypothetical protein